MPKILEELRSLVPPLSKEERDQLEKNLIADGEVLDPIIVWAEEDVIIDGMHRYEIAIENNLYYNLEGKSFPDIQAVKKWMIEHQIGRRNLNPAAMSVVRNQYREMVSSRHTKKKDIVADTASKFGVTGRTIYRDEKVAEMLDKAPPIVKKKVLSNDIEASTQSLQKLTSLPKEVQAKVADLVEYGADKDNPAFDSLEDAIAAVNFTQKLTKDQRIEKDEAEADKILGKLARIFDDRLAWDKNEGLHELCLAALKHLQGNWEQWKKPKSERYFQ